MFFTPLGKNVLIQYINTIKKSNYAEIDGTLYCISNLIFISGIFSTVIPVKKTLCLRIRLFSKFSQTFKKSFKRRLTAYIGMFDSYPKMGVNRNVLYLDHYFNRYINSLLNLDIDGTLHILQKNTVQQTFKHDLLKLKSSHL